MEEKNVFHFQKEIFFLGGGASGARVRGQETLKKWEIFCFDKRFQFLTNIKLTYLIKFFCNVKYLFLDSDVYLNVLTIKVIIAGEISYKTCFGPFITHSFNPVLELMSLVL